jgi:hypothetical protein
VFEAVRDSLGTLRSDFTDEDEDDEFERESEENDSVFSRSNEEHNVDLNEQIKRPQVGFFALNLIRTEFEDDDPVL